MTIEIEVCERMFDHTWDGKPKYHAQIKGRPGVWAASESIDNAIGDLIKCHPEHFGISVTILEGRQPR